MITFINLRKKCQGLSLDMTRFYFLDTVTCRLFGQTSEENQRHCIVLHIMKWLSIYENMH